MLFAITFLSELFALFFLSKLVTRRLSSLIYKLTKSQKATIYSMAFLFFPGTVIHELSHFLMAGLLFVPVGHIELWPKLEGEHIKLGSVAIAETDIFRRFFIGAAPFFLGTSLLLGLLFFAAQNNLFANKLYILLLGYAVFEIGNTMFSSQKDMEGAVELLAATAFFATIFYFLGVRLPAISFEGFFANPIVLQTLHQGSIFLLVPLGIDILLLVILKLPFFRRA
jgi:hypothetical protein